MIPPAHPSVGVYAHVPFCERVCPYCDFAVVAARPLARALEERYVEALLRELEDRRGAFAGRRWASLYLGGGTPSLLQPESVRRIVATVAAAFGAAEDAPEGGGAGTPAPEITLEVNPSSVERARLPGFREAGVDRLSIGVQSFDDRQLKRLGRAHRADEAHRTLEAARAAGFENVSVDLIFGAPESSLEQLEADLDALVAFGPEHVSAYELTVEPGTPFALAAERGQLPRPDEEVLVAMLERIGERLGAAGLERYEISSYARPGRRSRHNLRYWQRRPVLGLGVGAWSSDPADAGAPHGVRRANPRGLEAWLDAVEQGRPAAVECERLDRRTALSEAVFLGLRQSEGLDAALLASEFGGPPRQFFDRSIDELLAAGLVEEGPEGDLRLTARGRILSNSVFERFVA